MKFGELVRASAEVTKTRSRTAKANRLAALLRGLEPREVEPAVLFLSGELRQGRIGLGGGLLSRFAAVAPVSAGTLDVLEVDSAIDTLMHATGPGSLAQRERLLGVLFGKLTFEEREFFMRLVMGGLRQGALEGVLLDALARASTIAIEKLRRALLFAGSLGKVAVAALVEGEAGLAKFALELMRPLRPMLADSASQVSDALTRMSPAALEYKLDGARIQLHRDGSDVRVFSRQGNDVTASVPELVELSLTLPVKSLVLDGEALALAPSGRPLPFQTTMTRFGRRLRVEEARAELPLSPFFFDCLYLDGNALIDQPNTERVAALADRVPSALRTPRRVVSGVAEADAFFGEALASGHEGLVAKDPSSSYDAGRRGSAWLKLKPAHTLDLVVLAAEWGNGRRQGLLSNLHLGARDPSTGGFAMLGKTFKGLTDAMLTEQTQKLLSLALEREGHIVHVRPEWVVEVAFDGVQQSPHYASGFALRFARVKRFRPDKTASEADTIDRIRTIFAQSRDHGE